MCAIGGIYRRPGDHLAIGRYLDVMLDIQRHRGPDAEAAWLSQDNQLGLCHNRLAILDLSAAGNQPMHSFDGRYVIVFNGEIYNYRQLKIDLEVLGACFRSHSDTEVLIEAYRQWGEGMLSRLRGMFAFALYDQQSRTLLCARDRVGKKPFVYAQTSSAVVFASEIPAVKQVEGVDTAHDHAAIAAMLLHNLRHIPDPHTAYCGIKRLRAGHAMTVRDGQVERIWRYWEPTPAQGAVTAQRLREILEESVSIRMQADVPVGALLSGGVDSSAIVALMQRQSALPIHTYALGMNRDDEDLRRARVMAAQLGCEHKEFYFDAGRQWEVFRKLISSYGEPIMLLPLIHAYELSEAISADGVKVVLGGHGADELFYGYTGHVRTARLSALLPWVAPFSRLASAALGDSCSPLVAMLASSPGDRKSAFYRNCEQRDWLRVLTADARATLCNVAAEELSYWGRICPSNRLIDESNFVALMVENTHSVTISTDLPPMLASIEMRAPFLDQSIIEFALATPVHKKVPWVAPQHRLKWILRQAVRDLVPDELLFAPKRGFGFGIPQDQVLRDHWGRQGDDLFAHPDNLDGMFDTDALRALWQDFKQKGRGGSNVLANMFAIQYWLQSGELAR